MTSALIKWLIVFILFVIFIAWIIYQSNKLVNKSLNDNLSDVTGYDSEKFKRKKGAEKYE